MSQYQRLLLIINPLLRDSHAIHHAAALAKVSGASLHIAALMKPLGVLSVLNPADRGKALDSYWQEHRDWLNNLVKTIRIQGLEVTAEVSWADDLQQEILDHVAELHPDLLIKQVQHESALKRAFFTPLDWQLLRRCPVPVYMVGASGHALPRKVLAAVDVSDTGPYSCKLNDRIIQQASSLALQCDAELHLLHVCNTSAAYLADIDGQTLSALTEQVRKERGKSFLELAGRFGVSSDRRHFVTGHPVSALSEFAEEHDVDVIVMGRVQYHGVEKFLGSTIEHTLYQVPCNVLAVQFEEG
ncbi:universal stress protein [Halopseudomonas pelagia]|uniref:universal stress protein n=1 Tax=Halopseudomonas pelagia TaxID=553151 RepID=UPI00039CE56A|nr:universal stress protein [Halopseudomonas pelagia]|tara:strand:- start:74548 stop:75447 length:900 start_codon:yes stop_codon:yes gene_type:complete